MTPEEYADYVQKLQQEHTDIMGEYSRESEAIAKPEEFSSEKIMDSIGAPKDSTNEGLRQEHDNLFGTVGSQQPPPVIGHVGPAARPSSGAAQVPTGASPRDGAAADKASNDSNQGRWTRDTAKALDLSDAMRLGEYSQEPDDVSALSGVASASSDYMRRVAEILRSMQAMIIENTLHIEELQSRFHRMR